MAAGSAYVAALLAIDIRALPSSYTLTPTPHHPVFSFWLVSGRRCFVFSLLRDGSRL